MVDEPLTAELKADYPCRCGSRNCRGTLLSSDLDTAEGRKPKPKPKPKARRKPRQKA